MSGSTRLVLKALKGRQCPKRATILQEKNYGNIFGLLDTPMITPARDYTENSSIGVRWRMPISDEVENLGRDSDMAIQNEGWYRSSANSRLIRVGALAGLLFVLAVIGSAAALAWRAHIDLPLLAQTQRQDVHDLQAAVQRLELAQQQIVQRLDALQLVQQKSEQSRLADVQRLSENLTSLYGQMETVAKSSSKQETQKRSSAASAAPKSQASNTPRSGKPSAEAQN
jgi:hypothetical protein